MFKTSFSMPKETGWFIRQYLLVSYVWNAFISSYSNNKGEAPFAVALGSSNAVNAPLIRK
jgi:hypothetical protein